MTDESLARRWRSTTTPFLILRGAGQAAEFFGWVVLARRLGTETFGELAVAALICRYGGLIADWGASVRGVRDIAAGHAPAAIRALERRRVEATVVLSLVYLAGTVAFDRLAFAPLVIMLIAIGLNRDWIALGNEKGAQAATPTAIQGTALGVLALVASADLPSLVPAIAYGLGFVATMALNRLPTVSELDQPVSLRVDAWMLLAVFSNQVMSSADTLLIAVLASVSDAGIYAAIYRIPNGWLALLVIVRSALLPLAASVVHTDREQFLTLRRASLKWSGFSALTLVVLTPFAYFLVPVIFGAEYTAGQWPAVVLLLTTAIATVAAPLHHLFLAFGNDRPYGLILLGAALINLVVNLATIPLWGMMGAAIATLIANTALAIALWYGLERRLAGSPPGGRDVDLGET